MIVRLQKIPISFQSYLNSSILDKIYGLLNLTYIYSHIYKIFTQKKIIKLFKSLLKKEITISSQNGFGDILLSLIIAEFLATKKWKVNLLISYSEDKSRYLKQSLYKNKKEIKYGDYIQDFIVKYIQNINYIGKYPTNSKPSFYCHVPFFRLFISYNKILQTGNSLFTKSTKKKYISFYFRNNTKSIEKILDFVYNHTEDDIYLFGESIPDKYRLIEDDRIILTDNYNFNTKIELFTNSKFVVTGRGGFALLPLFINTDSITFFDRQGFDELGFGLWSLDMWSHCGIKRPIIDQELDIAINYIKTKYVN